MATMGSKALDPHVNDQIRSIVRELRDREFDGNAKAFAKRLGVSQPAISDFLSGKRGAGVAFIRKLALYTGRSTDDLLGTEPRAGSVAPNLLDIERALRDAEEAIARARKALRAPRLRKVKG